MKTEIVNRLSPELAAEWKALWNASPRLATAINAPEWVTAAVEVFKHETVRIIAVRGDDGVLKAVAALVRHTLYGVPVYSAPALRFADKQPVLIDWSDGETVRALVTCMRTLGAIYLTFCAEPVRHALATANGYAPTSFQDDQYSVVDLRTSPYGDLSEKRKNKLIKRMDEAGTPVEVIYSESDHTRTLELARQIAEVSVKRERGMSVLDKPVFREFFESLATADPRLICVSVLMMDKKPVAYSLDLRGEGMYMGSLTAYVRGSEYYQPGKYLTLKLLEYYHGRGFAGFDFGRGLDVLKTQFTQNIQPVHTVILAGRTTGLYLTVIRKLRHAVYTAMVRNKTLYKMFKNLRTMLPGDSANAALLNFMHEGHAFEGSEIAYNHMF